MTGKPKVDVEACLEGDRKTQKRLYHHFRVKMFGLCMRYAASREEAEDYLIEGYHNSDSVAEILHELLQRQHHQHHGDSHHGHGDHHNHGH